MTPQEGLNESAPSADAVYCRMLEPQDRESLIPLLVQTQFSLKGISNRSVCVAITNDCLKNEFIHCAVALDRDKVIGYDIGVRNWAVWKKGFVTRHPYILLQIVMKKVLSKFRSGSGSEAPKKERYVPAVVHPAGTYPYSWEDTDPTIGKSVYAAADPAYRKMGITSMVFDHMYEFLRQTGVWRYDGYIDKDNRGSIRMCEKMGWTFTDPGGEAFFIFKLLQEPVEVNTPA